MLWRKNRVYVDPADADMAPGRKGYDAARTCALATRLAIATGMAISAQPAYAKQSTEPVKITSFSGAYLAARVAEVDNDLDSAIAYYKQALAFDPENQPLQQSLMLALISQGRFDESLPYAEKLKTVPDVERFSRLALAVDAFRKKDYQGAETWLKLSLESDLDRLISERPVRPGPSWAPARPADALAIARRARRAGMVRPVQVLPPRADRRRRRPATTRPTRPIAATIERHRRRRCRARDLAARRRSLCRLPGPQGREGRGAGQCSTRPTSSSPGRLPLVALREKIAKGEHDRRRSSRRRPTARANFCSTSPRRSTAAAASPSSGSICNMRLALQPDSDAVLIQLAAVAEQQKRRARTRSRSIAASPTTSPLKRAVRAAARPQPRRSRPPRRGDRPSEGAASMPIPTTCAPIWRSAASMPRRRIIQLGRRPLRQGGRAQLDRRRPRANWNIFYQRGIAYERLKQWPKAEPNFRKALELFPTSRRC